MLAVTESAAKNVKDYLSQQNIDSPVRISLMSGGCSGPSLSLSLDEAQENDLTLEQDGVIFIMDKGLASTCGVVKVDFVESKGGCGCSGGGFSITSEKPLPGGGRSGCGGSCASGCC